MQAATSRKWRADDPRRLRMAETRAAILRAARPIMLRDGLGGTTLDRVAAEGGVAMREGLENAPAADTDKPIAMRLADELSAFVSALIEPDGLALYRLIVADGWRFPELARVFDRSGMRVIRQRIADLLEPGGAPGEPARRVAGEVVALALGDAYQRALLGIPEEGDGEAFARQIDAAVAYGLSRRA
jgi:TetR/AcrR family transcriptional repressor of mexJK operon